MNKRYLGAMILAPLLIVLFVGGKPLKYLVVILSLFGLYELFNAFKKKMMAPLTIPTYISCILYYILISTNLTLKQIILNLILIVFIMLCIPILFGKFNFIDLSVTLLSFVYVPIFFSFIVLTYNKTNGKYLVWLIFLSSWSCDTCAYYIGKYFGKAKISPKISPNKTIEGSIGGLVGSAVVCTLYGLFLIKNINLDTSLINFIIIGFLCGIFCQIGDLFASSIKRYIGIKDYSNLIPGHGGILDRFDSILFASVVVYYYITMFMRL